MILLDNITQNLWLAWFIAGIILIIVEIFTPGFVVFLIGVAALITGVTALAVDNVYIQFSVFGISMMLLLVFLRPVVKKYLFNKENSQKSNVDALIGKTVVVDKDIDNLSGSGYIKSGADYWKARSADGSSITKGSIVIIEKMEGITALVRLKNNEESEGDN